MGPGVGSSLIIHNNIYDNRRYGFSEMGHFLIGENMDITLESEVSTHAIVKSVRKIFSMENTAELFKVCKGNIENISAHNFIEWSVCNDKILQKIFDEKIMLMVKSTYNSMTLVPIDLVIYYGEIFENSYIKQNYEKNLEKLIGSVNRIRRSSLSSKPGYIGALAILFNRLFIGENNAGL